MVLDATVCWPANAAAVKPKAARNRVAVIFEIMCARILPFTETNGCSTRLGDNSCQKDRQHALAVCMSQNFKYHILPSLQRRP